MKQVLLLSLIIIAEDDRNVRSEKIVMFNKLIYIFYITTNKAKETNFYKLVLI